MMSKFFLFALLMWIFGNPFVAIVVGLIVLYALDRRFVGLSPSLFEPLKRNRRLAKLKRDLQQQPHDTSGKLEVARMYIQKKNYSEALRYLDQVRAVYDTAEVRYEAGLCKLKLGELAEGEQLITASLEENPRIKYGEPYLRLGEALMETDPDRSIACLQQFREVNSSSCEANYKLGQLYERLGKSADAQLAYEEALHVYRGLPRYKRRSERRWALLSRLRKK